MKNNTTIFKKISLMIITLMIMNLVLPTVSAIEFNPGTGKDEEEYKEYNAYLEQIQVSSVMGLDMPDDEFMLDDEFGDPMYSENDDSLMVEGTVRINKKLENEEVELLNELPTIELVDENNDFVASAEVICESEYTSSPSDLYYITFYDLSIENDKVYKLRTTFKDNEENEITKLITYSGKLMLSEGKNVDLKYMSSNNILNIVFNIKVNKENESSIDVTAKTAVAQYCIDGFSSTYNSGYKQIDFNKAVSDLESKFKTHFNNYMSKIQDGKMYEYKVVYNSHSDIDIKIRYLLDADSGATLELATKNVNIKYTNDSYTMSNSMKNKINNILSNIPTDTILEYELDSSYDNKIDSYDYKKNILKVTDNNIFVKDTPNTVTTGIINKFRYITFAIGSDNYIYNNGALYYFSQAVISVPKSYKTDSQRLSYATGVIRDYLKDSIYDDGYTLESITLDEEDKNIVNVKMVNKTSFGTTTITDEIKLKTIDYIKGDLDRNGVVNSNDAAIALDIYNGRKMEANDLEIGDMDKNGVINSTDAAMILDVYNNK